MKTDPVAPPAPRAATSPLRLCLAAAFAATASGLAGTWLVPRLPPDDAFRERLVRYEQIARSLGRGSKPPSASRPADGAAPSR